MITIWLLSTEDMNININGMQSNAREGARDGEVERDGEKS